MTDQSRILTTHTGSLPRPADLLELLWARGDGLAYDSALLDERIASAVEATVTRQVGLGVDIVSDGEMSREMYSNYVKDRLTGFNGVSDVPQPRDTLEFPELTAQRGGQSARVHLHYPACTGDIELVSIEPIRRELATLQRAAQAHQPVGAFVTAASPGVVTMLFRNQHYPSHAAYVHAVARAMRQEYEEIARHGLILQLDCPDLGAGFHVQFAGMSIEEFRRMASVHIDALNYAVQNIPAEQMRLHLCWGNYEGPHHYDIALESIIDIVLRAKPAGLSIEASNPRHDHEYTLFERVQLPEGKYLIPGVLSTTSNYIEHPELVAQRIERYAHLVGRERVMAGSDCGFGTIAGLTRVVPEVAWAKLGAMVEGAQIATRRLWN